MEQPVIISIKSTQKPTGADQDEMELVTQGMLYGDEEEGYTLTYEETSLTGLEGTTTTFLVRPDNITLIRVGTINNEMIFKVGEKHMSLYQTPYGGLMFGVNTRKAEADLSEKGGFISIRYMMEMEHETVSENSFEIQVSNPALPQ